MADETPATLRRTAEEGARLAGRVLAERFLGKRTIPLRSMITVVGMARTRSTLSAISALASRRMGRPTFVSWRKVGMARVSSSTLSAYTLRPFAA